MAVFSSFLTIAIGLISKKIFIDILGTEYLGLNGLFSNIIAVLGIAELGFGTAIIYNMYKPMADKDHEKIKSLMQFYKKMYRYVAAAVFVIGLSLMPFLSSIVGEVTIPVNIYVVYMLFILDTTASYILSYKRSILYVDQRNSVISLIHVGYLILNALIQISVLIITKNYYLYLVVKVLMNIAENIVIAIITNRQYPFIIEKNVQRLDKRVEKDIFKKIRAMFFHKIGSYVVMGTDNIIISRYLGLVTVGLYSNYSLVINSLNSLIGQGISALTPTVGHLLVTETKQKIFDTFKKIRFVNFWLATVSGCGIFLVLQPFVSIWIGEEYLLSIVTLAVLTFIYFQNLMRYTYSAFKDSAGIFYEDRFVPIVESLLNIVFSIILVKICGLPGVFIGTIISSLALWCYSYPKFVYKKLFDRSYAMYARETLGYILLFVSITATGYLITPLFNIKSPFVQVIVNVIFSIVFSNVVLIIIFRKNVYYIEMKKKIIKIIAKFYSKVKNIIKYRIDFIGYLIKKRDLNKVKILSDAKTIEKINDGYSIVRYGDGEFNIILHNTTPDFQSYSKEIGDRLRELLNNANDKKVLICIPKAFQDLKPLNRKARMFYVSFLNKNWKRMKNIIRYDYEYGNTNISRFYMDYRSKKGSIKRIERLKTIWDKKDIVIVEGEWTFFGVNNDLLDNCKSVKRIVCPAKNAFSSYDKIVSTIKDKVNTDTLVLIALGPTATLLAADLAESGYHAVDIGHLDIEYEWYLRKTKRKDIINGKAVNENEEGRNPKRGAFDTEQHDKTIIARIKNEE